MSNEKFKWDEKDIEEYVKVKMESEIIVSLINIRNVDEKVVEINIDIEVEGNV